MKVIRLSALRTGRLHHTGNIPGTRFCYKLYQHLGHSAAENIMTKKISSDTIWNRTGNRPAYSAVPQPNAPPRAKEMYTVI
jgi:hypothetical protein